MAYSVTNPPRMIAGALYGIGNLWYYSSADILTDVDTAGYFSNGGDLGMKVGDIVLVAVTGTGVISTCRVVSVSSTSPGAVNLGDGTTIGAAANTD